MTMGTRIRILLLALLAFAPAAHSQTVSVSTVTARVEALRAEGKTVSAQRSIPEKLRYAALCDLRKEETR